MRVYYEITPDRRPPDEKLDGFVARAWRLFILFAVVLITGGVLDLLGLIK